MDFTYKINDVVWVAESIRPAQIVGTGKDEDGEAYYSVEYCNGDFWDTEDFYADEMKPYIPRAELLGQAKPVYARPATIQPPAYSASPSQPACAQPYEPAAAQPVAEKVPGYSTPRSWYPAPVEVFKRSTSGSGLHRMRVA